MKVRNTGVVLILVILVSVAPQVWPILVKNFTVALQLRRMTDTERRETVIGLYYKPLHAIRQGIPRGESIAIVMAGSPLDRDVGVFVSYYLYPRPTILFGGAEAYATNQFEGAIRDRTRPETIVWIDHSKTPEPRLLTADELRTFQDRTPQ